MPLILKPDPSSYMHSGLILGVVVINIAIGLAQEGKAERAADAIKAMLSATATVVRDGKRLTLDADLLVPGDVVVVKSGDRLPADLRLLQARTLWVCHQHVRQLLEQ